MRRTELADYAERYIEDCVENTAPSLFGSPAALRPVIQMARSRFLGAGAEQYQISETEQSFERSTVGTMLVGKIEELVDDINYSAMVNCLIEREFESGLASRELGALLSSLQTDLADSVSIAATSAALMHRYVDRLVALGAHKVAHGDYVEQLRSEVAAAETGRAGSGWQDIEAATFAHAARNTLNLAPASPDDEAAIMAFAGELENESFIGIPEGEYRAGLAYISALEAAARDDGTLDAIRSELVTPLDEDDPVDEKALMQWFDDGGGD